MTTNFTPRNSREKRLYEQCIKLDELKDNTYYQGSSRNTSIALWSDKTQCFTYTRTKFHETFTDEIEHPENDRGYDVFFPLKEIK